MLALVRPLRLTRGHWRRCLAQNANANGHDKAQESFKDQWPLPGSPEHLESTATPPEELKVEPLRRANEPVHVLRARLVYQTRKRGTLESDLLLSTFASEWLGKMDVGELKEFDKLLDEPDWDLYYWATNRRAPPDKWEKSAILEKLRKHAANEGKVVRRMPDLH